MMASERDEEKYANSKSLGRRMNSWGKDVGADEVVS